MSGNDTGTAPNPQMGAGSSMPAQQDIFGQSANAYSAGTQGLQYAANPMAMLNTMNQFANPYREQVIDSAVGRMRDSRSQDMNMVQGQAAQANAFGGARHGLVEAELLDRYNQNESEMVSRLLQEGFTSNAQLAQASLGQTTGASQALVGAAPTGFNMGQSVLQGQQQAGQQQQLLNQSILNQAGQQFDQYINYPNTSLGTALAGIQGNPLAGAGTTTQQYNPGFFDYLRLAAGVGASGK